VRIVAGLMLALGPFFIAFLLFDGTRSLFEGWVRVLGGAALAAVGVAIALGLELALIEPWLSAVLARRMAGEALPTMPSELFVLVTLFTIVVTASLYGCARVAQAFRLPLQVLAGRVDDRQVLARRTTTTTAGRQNAAAEGERSRAAAVASMLTAMNRREYTAPAADIRVPFDTGRQSVAQRSGDAVQVARPIGRTFSRRATSRVSARANRRDASA
jgi:type IV secretion system protein VirB6